MTTTVRSVRVELEAGIASYVADMRLAGSETDKAFDRVEEKISASSLAVSRLERNTRQLARTAAESKVSEKGLGDEVDRTGEKVQRTSQRTKQYTLEMAVADEKSSRLRKSLRDQAKAAVDAEQGAERLAAGIDDTGKSAGRAERSIDKYSGRLRILTDLAILGGPALLRLGAGTLPAVSAGLVGLGAAAAGIGVTVLAVSGLKDGLKALNDYELERTPENLQKLRIEQEKLGPAGAHFLQYLNDLGPALEHVRQIARNNVLPGLEDSIDDTLTRLPIAESIVRRFSKTVAELARDGGETIASDRVSPILRYIRDVGPEVLDKFARSAGNVALGLSNIVVAFDPASQDFLDGLVDGTERFARATEHLDENQGFQDFLSEVRDAGPEVVDFLGAAGSLMSGLAQASAPVGRVVLPALTGVANVLGAIGSSPIGPPLYAGITALTIVGRVSDIASKKLDAFKTSGDQAGTSLSRIATRAAGIAAVGVAVGAIADNINRIDSGKLDASLTALGRGEVTDTIDKVLDSIEQLNSPLNKVDLGEIVTAGGLFGDSSLDKFADNIDQVDKALAQMVDTGNAAEAAALLSDLQDAAAQRGIDPGDVTGRLDDYALAVRNAGAAADDSRGLLSLFGGEARDTGDALHDAAAGAQDFSDALAGVNGWLDKRQALREYRTGIAELGKGFKDGFTDEDADNIDAVGRSITQVASLIKDKSIRADFLAGARASLVDLANSSGPKAKREVLELIGALDRYGLTKPKAPKLDADDAPARGKVKGLDGYFKTLTGKPYTAKVTAETAQAQAAINGVLARLGLVQSKSITITTYHNDKYGGQAGGGGHEVIPKADGGTIGGQRHPYGDKVLAMLAPGEEVISNRRGQADRFRADRAAGRIPRYAEGGTVGDDEDPKKAKHRTYVHQAFLPTEVAELFDNINGSAKRFDRALDRLQKTADKVSDSYDKQKAKLDDLTSSRDSLAASIAGAYQNDPFGNGLAGFDAQQSADAGDLAAMEKALATLVANGLSPKSALYQALAASADVNTAQQFAQLSAGDLASRAQRFQQNQTTAAAFGGQVAGDQYNEAIRDQAKATRELRQELRGLQQAIRGMHAIPDKVKEGAKQGTKEGSSQGTRDGQDDRKRRTSSFVRAGS